MNLLIDYAINQNGRLVEKRVAISNVSVLPESELHSVIKSEVAEYEQTNQRNIKILKWIEKETNSFEM